MFDEDFKMAQRSILVGMVIYSTIVLGVAGAFLYTGFKTLTYLEVL